MTSQLTSASGYDVKNIVCSEPKMGEVPKTDQSKKGVPVSFMRIIVNTRYPDGTVGDLILPTEELFSFGISENTSQETNQVTGHTMSLCLWNRDRTSEHYIPTKGQLEWTNTYNNIVNHLKSVLIDYHKKGMLATDSFTKYKYAKDDNDVEEHGGLTTVGFRSVLGKFNNLYWGKGGAKTAKPIPDKEGEYLNGPTLYAKLIESKKKGKVVTQFFDYNDNPIDALKVLQGAYCNVYAAIKIESIFIGNSISLQVKLHEANCKILEGGMTRLLSRPQADTRVLMGAVKTGAISKLRDTQEDDEKSEAGSLHEEEHQQKKPIVTAKTLQPRKKKIVDQPSE